MRSSTFIFIVKEALLPNPLEDKIAQSWLDAGDDADFLKNSIIKSAADAFGHIAVTTIARQLEAEGHLWQAAKRHYLALLTREGFVVGSLRVAGRRRAVLSVGPRRRTAGRKGSAYLRGYGEQQQCQEGLGTRIYII